MRALLLGSVLLAGCTAAPTPPDPADEFFANMQQLCGKSVQGMVISEQQVDEAWRLQRLIVGPVSCREDVIRMQLAVGADQSRTWVLGRTEQGLLFRHEHIDPDGTPSAVTDYGGLAAEGGTALRQDFPADDQTKATFATNGLFSSTENVWSFILNPEDGTLVYALARPATETEPDRDFRAMFDISQIADQLSAGAAD